jgi:hypothetical protein
VLRFASNAPPTKSGLSGRGRLRLWMLLISLGLVLAAMRHLSQPAAVESLDSLFIGPVAPSAQQRVDPKPDMTIEPNSEIFAGNLAPSSISPGKGEEDFSQVRDNSYFRPQEREAWFALFARLQTMDSTLAAEASLGNLTYAQLLQQSDVYRGKLVTIRGTVLREELQHPTDNDLGIKSYHRLWLRPRGGGQWPFVVYCLQLPDEFPRNDSLREEVNVTGFFFKNWSYAYDEGLGLAPVVLANSIDWQPPTVTVKRPSTSLKNMVWGNEAVDR